MIFQLMYTLHPWVFKVVSKMATVKTLVSYDWVGHKRSFFNAENDNLGYADPESEWDGCSLAHLIKLCFIEQLSHAPYSRPKHMHFDL